MPVATWTAHSAAAPVLVAMSRHTRRHLDPEASLASDAGSASATGPGGAHVASGTTPLAKAAFAEWNKMAEGHSTMWFAALRKERPAASFALWMHHGASCLSPAALQRPQVQNSSQAQLCAPAAPLWTAYAMTPTGTRRIVSSLEEALVAASQLCFRQLWSQSQRLAQDR